MSRREGAVVAGLVVSLLTGCSAVPDFDMRYGPSPEISASDLETQVKKQNGVMDLLMAGTKGTHTPGAGAWYDAALVGFNYVDDECSRYLRLNFRLTRMRDRDTAIVDTLSNSTSAFLKAASVVDPTITTISAALGLGANLTKAYMNSFLFSMDPNIVFRTVTKLQNSYRTQFEAHKSEVVGPAVAYRAVQNYYTLCFPQTIEAKMSEFVSEAVAGGTTAKTAATTATTTGTSATVATIDASLKSPQ